MRTPTIPLHSPWLLAMAVVAAAGLFLAADCSGDEDGTIPNVFRAVSPTGNVGEPGERVTFVFDLDRGIRDNQYDALHWTFGGGAFPRSLVSASRSVTVTLRDEGSYRGEVSTIFDNSFAKRYLFEFTVVD